MARTISWIPRLKQIRAAVEKSPLSVWERTDLENLFELQASAATNMLRVIPRGRGPGRSLLVEREALLAFLDRVERTGKLPTSPTKVSRKKLRLLVRPVGEVEKGKVADIPNSVKLTPGQLVVDFDGAEDLIRQLWTIALAARNDFDAFEALCVAQPERRTSSERDEVEAELKEMESAFRGKKKPVKVA